MRTQIKGLNVAEVTSKNKALYEILEVSADATYPEIQAAYQRISQKIESEITSSNREELEYKLKMLGVAYHTLAYDSKIVKQNASANIVAPHTNVVAPPNFEAVSLKADAVSLKADAMSFKADAMALKADALSLRMSDMSHLVPKDHSKFPASIESDSHLPLAIISSTVVSSVSALKKIIRIIAGVMVLGVVIKVFAISVSNRQAEHAVTVVPNVDEKVFLQEYYQTHGVRVGSKIEADLLDAENRRKENLQREAARNKQMQEEADRRFAEESRQEGARISEQLRRDEQAARYEEQRKQQQLAQEKREQEEAERYRIEEDRRKTDEARRSLGLN